MKVFNKHNVLHRKIEDLGRKKILSRDDYLWIYRTYLQNTNEEFGSDSAFPVTSTNRPLLDLGKLSDETTDVILNYLNVCENNSETVAVFNKKVQVSQTKQKQFSYGRMFELVDRQYIYYNLDSDNETMFKTIQQKCKKIPLKGDINPPKPVYTKRQLKIMTSMAKNFKRYETRVPTEMELKSKPMEVYDSSAPVLVRVKPIAKDVPEADDIEIEEIDEIDVTEPDSVIIEEIVDEDGDDDMGVDNNDDMEVEEDIDDDIEHENVDVDEDDEE